MEQQDTRESERTKLENMREIEREREEEERRESAREKGRESEREKEGERQQHGNTTKQRRQALPALTKKMCLMNSRVLGFI